MRGRRFSEEQIIRILAEQEAGRKVGEICREHGIAQNTFYRWKSKYGGMTVSEAKRLKALEEENRNLKQMVAEQALDIRGLKAAREVKY
jgi:putative transposase